MNIIEKAANFAHAAHDSIGQKRKYSLEPYWVHTDEVSNIVRKFLSVTNPNYAEIVAAANLHDVLEDVFPLNSFYSPERIQEEFGIKVLDYVLDLTDEFTREKYPNLNRRERKLLEAERIGEISDDAKIIKLADLISNSKDILRQDPNFAKVYLAEKKVLLEKLVGVHEQLHFVASLLC